MIPVNRNDPKHRALARLVLARGSIADAERAASYVTEKIKSWDDPLFRPLECAVVVCYCRPFIGTRISGRISARYEAFDIQGFGALHRYLIEHRNGIVAHTDEAMNVVSFLPPGAKLKSQDGKFEGVSVGHGDHVSSRAIKLPVFAQIVELCNHQLERLAADIETKKNALLAEPQTGHSSQ